MHVACLNCGRPYPNFGASYRCPACGGLYDYVEPIALDVSRSSCVTFWDRAALLGFDLAPLTLGEGNTPLMECEVFGRRIYLKCENTNPTGSFKDRGTATLVSFLRSRGITEAIEDSSGNAGASFAAYAARADIRARVYVPENASGPKRAQIEMYGAEVAAIPGPRSSAAEAAWRTAEGGLPYASHAYLPFNLPGYATCALEIAEQLGDAPAVVVLPVGQGGFLLGLERGFRALLQAGRISRMPALVGVQAAACAPLAALFDMGIMGLSFVTEGTTVAEGVRVRSPLRARAVVDAARQSGGRLTSVDEAAILPARDSLARLGFYVEPTSALVWPTVLEIPPEIGGPIVAVLTGSGYKVRN